MAAQDGRTCARGSMQIKRLLQSSNVKLLAQLCNHSTSKPYERTYCIGLMQHARHLLRLPLAGMVRSIRRHCCCRCGGWRC